jgi:hypothetical protein
LYAGFNGAGASDEHSTGSPKRVEAVQIGDPIVDRQRPRHFGWSPVKNSQVAD